MLLGSPAKLLGNYPQELNKQSANDSVCFQEALLQSLLPKAPQGLLPQSTKSQTPQIAGTAKSQSIGKHREGQSNTSRFPKHLKAYAAVRLQAECLLLPVNIEPSPGTACLCRSEPKNWPSAATKPCTCFSLRSKSAEGLSSRWIFTRPTTRCFATYLETNEKILRNSSFSTYLPISDSSCMSLRLPT